jgi:hypothetical protein
VCPVYATDGSAAKVSVLHATLCITASGVLPTYLILILRVRNYIKISAALTSFCLLGHTQQQAQQLNVLRLLLHQVRRPHDQVPQCIEVTEQQSARGAYLLRKEARNSALAHSYGSSQST